MSTTPGTGTGATGVVIGGTKFTKKVALDYAIQKAHDKLGWRDGPAKIFTRKFEGVFGKNRFPWCGAFVTWCLEQAGLNVPVNCPTGYTFALVEAWQIWARAKGFYIDNAAGVVGQPGDIVIFDWDQRSINDQDTDWDDHIGFIIERLADGTYRTAEGNVQDTTAIKVRPPLLIQGFIRIPDGYKF